MLRTLLLAPALAGAFSFTPQDPDASFDGGAPVLVVDGVEISADEYTRWLIESGASRFGHDFAERWVVAREADRRGVVVADAEVAAVHNDQVQQRITHAFKGDREGWLDELRRTGRTEGGYHNQQLTEMRPEIVCKAMVAADRVVPEEKITREWELKYGPRGVDLELLMMKFQVEVLTPPTGSDPSELERNRERAFAEQKAVALEVRGRILAGEDFGELAWRFSDDRATREGRGRMGKAFRWGGWSHDFVDAMLQLQPGDLSEPLYARGGWWLVRCLDRTDTDREDVHAELEAMLIEKGPEQDEVGNLWNELTEDVYYELTPELFGEGSRPEGGETIGIVVNGEPIPRRVLAAWLLAVRGDWQARYFAEHWLVERKARELGIEVTDQEIEDAAQRRLDWMLTNNPNFKGSREAWVTTLNMSGQTVDGFLRELRHRVRIDLLAEKSILRQRVVTEEMVRGEWERQFGSDGRWVEARVIQLDVRPPDIPKGSDRETVDRLVTGAVEVTRLRAADVVARLRGGEDFATIARQVSDERISAAMGGRLEGRFRPDAWDQEIADAVMALEVGEVSGPLFGKRSYFVFEVTSSRPVPFEEARADLESELRDRRPPTGDLAAYRNVLVKEVEYEALPGMWEQ